MKALDRLLQRWRIDKARPYVSPGDRVLDIGCADGALFHRFGELIGRGVGIDDDLSAPVVTERYELRPGTFPEALDDEEPFQVIALLAVLEHVPRERQSVLATGCYDHLAPGGYLVVTTPSPLVDPILDGLKLLRVIDGMALEEHYGFEPGETPAIFTAAGLDLVESKKFQLGLNNLFVFQRPRS